MQENPLLSSLSALWQFLCKPPGDLVYISAAQGNHQIPRLCVLADIVANLVKIVILSGIVRLLGFILREPDGTLVFCEVKTRAKDSLDTPAAAVNAAKQRRIIASAAWYLQSTHQSDEPVRFDVAEVVPLDSGRWMVHIIKGAFCAK